MGCALTYLFDELPLKHVSDEVWPYFAWSILLSSVGGIAFCCAVPKKSRARTYSCLALASWLSVPVIYESCVYFRCTCGEIVRYALLGMVSIGGMMIALFCRALSRYFERDWLTKQWLVLLFWLFIVPGLIDVLNWRSRSRILIGGEHLVPGISPVLIWVSGVSLVIWCVWLIFLMSALIKLVWQETKWST